VRAARCASQQQEPSFGAIPSTSDRQKKKQEEEELASKADEILQKILAKDALERLTFTEVNDASTVRAHFGTRALEP
jgi:DNA-binding TFAR19-related protein (PDSD5 family)